MVGLRDQCKVRPLDQEQKQTEIQGLNNHAMLFLSDKKAPNSANRELRQSCWPILSYLPWALRRFTHRPEGSPA